MLHHYAPHLNEIVLTLRLFRTTMALGETLANSEGQAHCARASACAKDRREAAQDCCKFVIDQ